MNLHCSVCVIHFVVVSDSLAITPNTRVTCASCCSQATQRKVELLETGHRAVAESLAATPQLKRPRRTLKKEREWDGETNLGSPREEAAALTALVRSGRATADDVRELIAVPAYLGAVLQRFDEVTGLRTMNRILAWRKLVLVEFERIAA